MDANERFNALYRTHATAVLRYACRRTDPDTARDVVAETFLVAWRKLAAVPVDPAQAEPWLYGVARRVLANVDRSTQRTLRLAARLWDEGHDDQVPDPAAAISERQRICQALGQLSELDQEVLRLMGWEELSIAGAAVAMGCSLSAMTVRVHRARRRMRRALRTIDGGEHPLPSLSQSIVQSEFS